MTEEQLQALAKQHGGVTGRVDEQRKEPDPEHPNGPEIWSYTGNFTVTFGDGSQITLQDLPGPTQAYQVVKPLATPARTTPTDPSNLVEVHANPKDPNSPVIALMDPATGKSYDVPKEPGAPTPSQVNEAALNQERAANAANTKWGRVTNAERAALEAKERAEGRQLSIDEQNATLAQSRENRAVSADERAAAAAERTAANQAASNEIARARLALDQQQANRPRTQVIGGKIVNVDTGQVVFEDTTDQWTFQDTPGGGIIAINKRDPQNKQTILPDQIKPPQLIPGQDPTKQDQFLFTDPKTGDLIVRDNPLQRQPTEVSGQNGPTILRKMPDGTYQAVPNPAYQSKFQQGLSDYQNAISIIEGQLSRGEITVDQANTYKGALKQNFDAALQGTTPYQQQQDRMAAQQKRLEEGRSLLNQRVAAGSGMAQSLLNSAVGIASNKNFMDPSAVAGFSPFSGAADYVTALGGGQGIYDAATQAVQQGLGNDPASALLNAAVNNPAPTPQAQTLAPPPAAAPTAEGSTPADVLLQGALAPAGTAGTVPSSDPRFLGNGSTNLADTQFGPATSLLIAALGRDPRQFLPNGPTQRGPLYG